MGYKKKLECFTDYPFIKVEKLGTFVNKQVVEVDEITAGKLLSTGCFKEVKEEIKKKKGGE